MQIALRPFLQTSSNGINLCMESRLKELFSTHSSSLLLSILIVRWMCSICNEKLKVHLYHSLEKKHEIQFCGNDEFTNTKYDLAIIYINMRYVMYLVDKNFLGKRKTFWGDEDQQVLVSLTLQNPHLTAKNVATKYLQENPLAFQSIQGIVEKIYNTKRKR